MADIRDVSWLGIFTTICRHIKRQKDVTIHMKTYVHLWNWLLQWGGGHTVTPVTYKTRAEKAN